MAAVVVVIVAAFSVRRRRGTPSERPAPSPWLVGAVALATSSVFMGASLLLPAPGSAADWIVVGLYLGLHAVVTALVLRWSPRRERASVSEPVGGDPAAWDDRHRLALAGGALLTYVWYGWPAQPVVGAPGQVDLVGHAVFTAGAIVLLAVTLAKIADNEDSLDKQDCR